MVSVLWLLPHQTWRRTMNMVIKEAVGDSAEVACARSSTAGASAGEIEWPGEGLTRRSWALESSGGFFTHTSGTWHVGRR